VGAPRNHSSGQGRTGEVTSCVLGSSTRVRVCCLQGVCRANRMWPSYGASMFPTCAIRIELAHRQTWSDAAPTRTSNQKFQVLWPKIPGEVAQKTRLCGSISQVEDLLSPEKRTSSSCGIPACLGYSGIAGAQNPRYNLGLYGIWFAHRHPCCIDEWLRAMLSGSAMVRIQA